MKLLKYFYVSDPRIAEANVVDSDSGIFVRLNDEPELDDVIAENKALRARITTLEAEKAALEQEGDYLDAALLSGPPIITATTAHQAWRKLRGENG